jgi:hypothetical protein
VVVALLGVSLSTPLVTTVDTTSVVTSFTPAADYGHIDGVPYVWQEINGYCYWSSVDMALQYIDIPYDLYQFFAASGIGFSAAYIMIEDAQIFVSGSSFRQQQQVPIFCDVLGIDHMAYFDSNAEWLQLYESSWFQSGFNMELIDGSEAAFNQLRNTIDEGYPVVLWVDPYWLPAIDYVELRDFISPQDPATPSTGHAIVVIGYNDTSQTVEILDPGVGSFGSRYGYPDDGRWSYTANYSTLELAWKALAYGQIAFTPDDGEVQDQEERIGNMIVSRLLGNRTLAGPDLEEVFFASFGETAFRGLSLDTTVDGIKNYLDKFNETIDREDILMFTGISHETYMSLQYPAYRGAIESLPSILPSYDISEVVELGRTAYPHFDAISTNDSVVSVSYRFDGTLLASTFFDISDRYVTTGNLDSSIEAYSSEIQQLSEHFLAIADSWKAAGELLDSILAGESFNYPLAVVFISSISGLFVVLVVVWRVRK